MLCPISERPCFSFAKPVQEGPANHLMQFNKDLRENEAFFNDRLQMPHFLCALAGQRTRDLCSAPPSPSPAARFRTTRLRNTRPNYTKNSHYHRLARSPNKAEGIRADCIIDTHSARLRPQHCSFPTQLDARTPLIPANPFFAPLIVTYSHLHCLHGRIVVQRQSANTARVWCCKAQSQGLLVSTPF